jgi:ribosomal protein L18E
MNWGYPSINHLKRLMREAYTYREEAYQVGQQAKKDIAENLNETKITSLMIDRLNQIKEKL